MSQADASSPPAAERRVRGAVWTWLALGVVVAVVGTVVLVKLGNPAPAPDPTASLTATSPTVLTELTSIPDSTYDQVGVSSTIVPLVRPLAVMGEPSLTFATAAGRRLPGVVFYGAEFCSFCAAERWPLIAALSRFGTFSKLYEMSSTSTDYAPDTPSFTFDGVGYSSSVLAFRGYEVRSNVREGATYAALMHVPASVRALVHHYDATMQYPFVDAGNAIVVLQAAFSPLTLAGESRESIAAALQDPTNPVTRAIVASANLLTAGICSSTGQMPSPVCDSRGVRVASAALHLAR